MEMNENETKQTEVPENTSATEKEEKQETPNPVVVNVGVKKSKLPLIIILAVIVIAALVVIFVVKPFGKKTDENLVTTNTVSTLQKTLEIADLSTLEYPWNGIAVAYDIEVIDNNTGTTEKTLDVDSVIDSVLNLIGINRNKAEETTTVEETEPESETEPETRVNVHYHVAYEGKVTFGVDFSRVIISADEENKIITIEVPDVEIQEVSVDSGKMEYIFENEKYNTESVLSEALKLCEADLRSKVEEEDYLRNIAQENAISIVEALTRPWIETTDSEYQIVIK